MSCNFIQERLNATKLQIIAYEDAALALASGVQSYSLDTGQNVQKVTKLDLAALQRTLSSLYNRFATLTARLNGGEVTVVPAW